MASLAGIISQYGKIGFNGAKQMRRMLRTMRHRGPDNTIVRSLSDDRGALGANEINLAPHRTYCTSLEDMPYILFDGRLFNERPDGQRDIELFRDLYEKHEHNCFRHLDGSFSCAVVEKDDEVILARDHVGARPLFFGRSDSTFYFSTEMKALKDHVQFNIQELPPGHIYSSKKGLKDFQPFSPEVPEPGDLKEAAEILRELLIEAVRRRMDDVNAISLSGGLDSSIIAAIAKEFNPNLHLFTGTVQEAPGPDLENAKLMAEFLGLEHHIYEITEADIIGFLPEAVWYMESFDEDCISGIISNYFVSRKVKEYSNAVLVGEGADELFGGYRMVLKNPKVKSSEQRERLAQKLLDIAYNTALRRLDRAWMANAVVYKTPFLDTRVVAFSKKIPMEWKIYGEKQKEKYILREAFRDMLPEKIANREKLRFAMGTGMDDVMDDIVSNIIDPEEIKYRPKAAYGLPFASYKELYYYDEFLQVFPPSYEQQTIRWDPFK
ncbi:MAG: asparagine synthase-related protein [Desulfobacteraceae bacterium]|jgi:asparagine synthase (glutamine-hydrolysing)